MGVSCCANRIDIVQGAFFFLFYNNSILLINEHRELQ